MAGVVAVAFPLTVLAVTVLRGSGGTPAPAPSPSAAPLAPAVPGERSGPAAAWDSPGRRLVLFGGFGRAPAVRGQVLGDTWTWTAAGGWQRLRPSISPPARVGAGLAVDSSAGGSLLLAGGYGTGGEGPLDDAWSFRDSGWVAADGTGPAFATLPVLAEVGGIPLLVAPGAAGRSTTWRWTPGGWRAAVTGDPVLGSQAVAVMLPPAGLLLVDRAAAGGGETWSYDGRAWTLLPDAGPASFNPIGASLAADPLSGRPILTQVGRGPSTPSLLAWNGAAWTPGPPPPPAPPAAMVVDTTDHRLLALVPDGSGGLAVVALGPGGWSAAR